MNVLLSLNDQWFHVHVTHFFRPLLLLDFKSLRMHCQKTDNHLTVWLPNPRVNIDLIMCTIRFFFDDWPAESTLGQVVASCSILYNCDHGVRDTTACILFLRGLLLQELLIYVPHRLEAVLRELKFKTGGAHATGRCLICCEEDRSLYRVHAPPSDGETDAAAAARSRHMFCLSCIVRFPENVCPLCRGALVH